MKTAVEFYDIFDYYEPSLWQSPWFKIGLACVGVVITIALVYLFLRKKKKSIQPWEWAHQQIGALSLEQCKSKNDYKKFYFDVTTILKQYLNKRYGWKTEDKTDEELTEFLNKHGFEKIMRNDDLKKMLEGAMWIKFAGEDVIKTQAEADLKTARTIIEKTTPKELNATKTK